jgi:hypothetical protein
MLRVALDDQLCVAGLAVFPCLDSGNENVGQFSLHLRMQMDFRLFNDD